MRMDEPQYSLKVSVAATRHGLAHHQKPVLVLLLSPLLLQNRLLVFACLPLADKHHGDICADRVKARLAAIRSLVSGAETNVRLYHRQYVHVVMLARLWEEARAGTVLSRLFPTMPGPPKHGFKQFHPPVSFSVHAQHLRSIPFFTDILTMISDGGGLQTLLWTINLRTVSHMLWGCVCGRWCLRA